MSTFKNYFDNLSYIILEAKINFQNAITFVLLKLDTTFKGECSVLKKKIIIDENDALSEYNEIPLGHNRTNGTVYSKIYFKVEICSAH